MTIHSIAARRPNRTRAMAHIAAANKRMWWRPNSDDLHLNIHGWIGESEFSGQSVSALAVEAVLSTNENAGRVFVHLNSMGGRVAAAERIIAAIRNHRGFVTVEAHEWCASAAIGIMLAADFRCAYADTKFLVHTASVSPRAGERWTARRHARVAQSLSETNAFLAAMYAEQTGRSVELFEQEMQNEQDMGVEKARLMGLIHVVSGEETWRDGRPLYEEVCLRSAQRKLRQFAAQSAITMARSGEAPPLIGL